MIHQDGKGAQYLFVIHDGCPYFHGPSIIYCNQYNFSSLYGIIDFLKGLAIYETKKSVSDLDILRKNV